MQSQSGDTSVEWAALTAMCGLLAVAAVSSVGGEILALADIVSTLISAGETQPGG